MIEQRRYQRAPLDVAVEFHPKGGPERRPGRAKDISLGGMFVECATPLPFGAELVIEVTLPGQRSPFSIPAIVRWSRPSGMGLQFGLLGARETHAITELTKAP